MMPFCFQPEARKGHPTAVAFGGHVRGQGGFSLLEMLVGLVVGAIVTAGAYSIWKTNHEEGFRLEKKIELRNQMTLSSKKLQRAVTLAGIGLNGAANLEKIDDVGSDTLIIYTNARETGSALLFDIAAGATYVKVAEPSLFSQAGFIAVGNGSAGEIRAISAHSGSVLHVASPFDMAYSSGSARAYPAAQERYFTDQENNLLIREMNGSRRTIGKGLCNFQASFRNNRGEATSIPGEVRTVQYSFTGIFPAREGALNSLVFSSTAIPRNTL